MRYLALLVLWLMLIPLALTHSMVEGQTPRRGGTLIVAMDADPPTLNPITTEALQAFYPANQIYDTLVGYDEKFNPIPRLANSWSVAQDAKTFRFNLVRNVRWHDGRPFSSADVKFTFETLGPKYAAAYKSIFGSLVGVDTPDPNTVVLRFSEPNAIVLSFIGDPALSILPKHIFESGDARTNPASNQPVGTGPFKFKEWVRGDHLTLVRNGEYFQPGQPYLDQVVFRVIPNPASQIAALERGDVSMVLTRVSPVDARRLRSSPTFRIVSPSVAARIIALWPNMRAAPLKSFRVRQALSLAADRQRMVEQIALGESTPSRAPIASTSPYFDPTLPELKRDLPTANRILDEAGLRRGADGIRFTVRLHHVATVSDFLKTAQILKENFEDVGIRVNVVAGETTATLDAIFKNWDFDLAVYSATMGPEPGTRWITWFTTDGLTRAYFANATGYQNLRIDHLVRQSVTVIDKGKRTNVYREIERIVMGDLPLIPLWEPKFLSAYRSEFENAFKQPGDRYINFARTWFRGR